MSDPDSALFAGRPQHLLKNMYVDQSIELTSDFFERSYMKETHEPFDEFRYIFRLCGNGGSGGEIALVEREAARRVCRGEHRGGRGGRRLGQGGSRWSRSER